jgi:hypothetical protein
MRGVPIAVVTPRSVGGPGPDSVSGQNQWRTKKQKSEKSEKPAKNTRVRA